MEREVEKDKHFQRHNGSLPMASGVYVLYFLVSCGLESTNGAHKYPISSKLMTSGKIIKCSSFIVLPQ